MKRSMLQLLALLIAVLCAFGARAQDAQKPEAQQQPGAKPAEEAQQQPAAKPAPETEKPRPGPGQQPDPEIFERMFACLAEGLPKDWKKAWFVINEIERNDTGSERNFEAKFFFATNAKDAKGRPLRNCGGERVLEEVGALNDYLPESQRRWTGATFAFTRDGKYDVKYDYTPRKPAPAKRAAKKKQDSSK